MRKLFWIFTVLWLLGCFVVFELGASLKETFFFVDGPHLYNRETGEFQPANFGDEAKKLRAEVEQGNLLSREVAGVGENADKIIFYVPKEHADLMDKAITDFIQEREAAWEEMQAAKLRRQIGKVLFYVLPPIGFALLLIMIHWIRRQRAGQPNAG